MPIISDSKKLDIVFKAFIGRQHTTSQKAWYEEHPGPFIYPHQNEIWLDPIPYPPPSTSTPTVQVFNTLTLTEDTSTPDHKAHLACQTPGDLSTRIFGFIPPKYGQLYTVRVYDASNTEIPTTHPVKWFFNYETGILVFEENPLNYGINLPIKIKAYRYTGRTGIKSTFISDIDGGTAQETYAVGQAIDGGGAATVFLPSQVIDGGDASAE